MIQELRQRVQELEASESELMEKLGIAKKALFKPTIIKKSFSRQKPDVPILGYWDIRGLGQAIRYQLKYQGIDFTNKTYDTTDAQARQSWYDEKHSLGFDFPNLPYFVDTDGFCMTETLAIMEYIAEKWMPELLGATYQDRAKVKMLSAIIHQSTRDVRIPCYSSDEVDWF